MSAIDDEAELDAEAPPIEVRDLHSAYGDHVIHDHLNLTVRRGDVLGVVGGSGAGKSVLLNTIIGLKRPEAGSVRIFGADIRHARRRQWTAIERRWGVLFQQGALWSNLTVKENVAAPLFEHTDMGAREIGELADLKIALAGLPALSGALKPSELSGGMIKRASLARALALDPELLFLDEPTSGLDPQSRLALWDVIGELHANGQTIVLTTHYMEEADTLCRRVAIVDHGRLLALDTPTQLKATIGADTELRIQASGDLQALANDLAALPGIDSARVVDDTVYAYVSHGGPTLSDVITHADRQGFAITDVGVKETTLETVFINLTGRDLRE